MKFIPVKHSNNPAIVDDDDYVSMSKYAWQLSHKGYAERTNIERVGEPNGKCRPIRRTKQFMHRVIMQAQQGLQVDHANHDKLDNRKSNLRLCTQSENLRNGNKRTIKGKSSSKFKGVRKHGFFKKNGKPKYWARITIPSKRMSLGVYESEEEAARAYDAAALQHFGEFARLNFPPC